MGRSLVYSIVSRICHHDSTTELVYNERARQGTPSSQAHDLTREATSGGACGRGHKLRATQRSFTKRLTFITSSRTRSVASSRILVSLRRPLTCDLQELSPTTEAHQCRLPSFTEAFSDVIAAHDVASVRNYCGPNLSRKTSAVSLYSEFGGLSTGPGPTPLSTAHTSPAVSPIAPCFNINNQSRLHIRVNLGNHNQDALRELDEEQQQRLAPARYRRPCPRPSPYGDFDTRGHPRRRACSSRNSRPPTSNGEGERDRHFNQKYRPVDRLFIVWGKDDENWGWHTILRRRLPLLPVLLGCEYDRSVEENRKVAGLNGMYYRENDLNFPVLTPDGSGLVLVKKDGRWWECTKSQKCRTDEHGNSIKGRKRGAAAAGGGADPRPRGMVERYPEEVLLYWNQVRAFVPEEKRAEVYARAERYCEFTPSSSLFPSTEGSPVTNRSRLTGEIRAEQRRQYGVPEWSPDNKEDRVLDLNPPKKPEEGTPTTLRARAARKAKRS